MAAGPIHLVFVHGMLSSGQVWTAFQQLIDADPDLADFVSVHRFEYDSPKVRLRPDRRIAEIDDVADLLRTYLSTEFADADSIVLVTHSLGGLVVQRFLTRMLSRGEGRALARIRRIVMFACPNSGSSFWLCMRRLVVIWRNPQERQLRPHDRAVMETQQILLRAVVNASACTDGECPIPIAAYGGVSDRIVPPVVSAGVWSTTGTIEGDHFSVVQPTSRLASSYRLIKAALIGAGSSEDAPAGAAFEHFSDRRGRVSVTPPFGRRDAPLHGRDKLIASIRSSSDKSQVHVLAGLGGSGKSRLALEIAHLAQEKDLQVWWVQVTRVNSGMREVASQLGAPDNQVERAWRGSVSATDLVWRFLDANPAPWLLVLDNADDPEDLGPLDGSVSDGTGWLRRPAASNGMVIVTSRDRNQDTWGPWSVVHPVLPLDENDGASMLMDHAGPAGGTNEQARLLSAELGGLPLALRAAADYVKSVGSSRVWRGGPSIRNYDDYRVAVRRRFESPPGAYGRDLNEPGLEVVRGVFDLSLESLDHRGLTQAAPLLKLLACLNITPIPYHILLGGDAVAESSLFTNFDSAQRATALGALADLGLVELHILDQVDDENLSHVLSLHPLVHGILRDDEDVERRRADYYGLSVRMLLAATIDFDPDYPESWVIWNILAPHANEAAKASLLGVPRLAHRGVLVAALELARLTGRYLIVTGLAKPASDLVQPIIDNCQSFGFHEDDREILALRHEKARIALERGDPEAAEAELRGVIVGRESILTSDHPDTLASRHKLAKAVLDQGRWAEAEPLLRSIVSAENEVRGPEHSDTMVVRHSLARAILAQDRAAEAETMIRDILQVRNRIWSSTTPETLFARQTLARSLLEQRRPDEAEHEMREALREAIGRPEAPEVLSLRHTLITVRLMQGHISEALADLELLLADRRRVLGVNHPETERTSELLAKTRRIPDHSPGTGRPPSGQQPRHTKLQDSRADDPYTP